MIQKTFSLPPKVRKCEVSTASTFALTVIRQLGLEKHVINSVHSRPMATTALRYIVQNSKSKFIVQIYSEITI